MGLHRVGRVGGWEAAHAGRGGKAERRKRKQNRHMMACDHGGAKSHDFRQSVNYGIEGKHIVNVNVCVLVRCLV